MSTELIPFTVGWTSEYSSKSRHESFIKSACLHFFCIGLGLPQANRDVFSSSRMGEQESVPTTIQVLKCWPNVLLPQSDCVFSFPLNDVCGDNACVHEFLLLLKDSYSSSANSVFSERSRTTEQISTSNHFLNIRRSLCGGQRDSSVIHSLGIVNLSQIELIFDLGPGT